MTEDFTTYKHSGRHRPPGFQPRIQRLANLAVKETNDPDGPTATELREALRGIRHELDEAAKSVNHALWQEWDQGKARTAVAGLATLLGYLQGSVPTDPADSE
jgi:hypothetical protein